MKVGIDYFPLDCHLERNVELIEADFGLKGFAIVVKLWQSIYAGKGYYCEWSPEIALLFAKDIGASSNVVSEVVQATLKREVFDKSIFDSYNVLTSHGIQIRYLEAAKRRKKVRMEKEYLLISADEIPKNVCIFENNVCVFPKSVDNPEQSKVEESKEKESIGEEVSSASPTAPKTTRESLVEKYGSKNVSEYEKRFDKWKAKKGGVVRADRYETIEKMLKEDGVRKSNTSFNMEGFNEIILNQYKRRHAEGKELTFSTAEPKNEKE